MSRKISKTNSDLNLLNARIDEMRISSDARRRAKASLARAAAVADTAAEIINIIKRLAQTMVIRPYRRLTTSLG